MDTWVPRPTQLICDASDSAPPAHGVKRTYETFPPSNRWSLSPLIQNLPFERHGGKAATVAVTGVEIAFDEAERLCPSGQNGLW